MKIPLSCWNFPKKNWYFYPRAWTPEKSSHHTLCVCEKQLYFSSTLNFLPGRDAPACYTVFIDRSFGIELDDGWNVWSFLVCSSKISHSSCSPPLLLCFIILLTFCKGNWECVLFRTQNETSRELEQENRSNRELYTLVCARTKTTVEKWEMASEGNELESKN